ncbi:MAG: hypothetical protein F4Y55_02040 [Gammaproteobacteria bacterium]|nr:hypothetical protein [Gammaproteobacteria bacterium]
MDQATSEVLDAYQAEVDTAGNYEEQVRAATQLWRPRAARSAFRRVRAGLVEMCAGAQRCCWCEDSAATDIEHIWPKSLYPERTFRWENYLLACGGCNRHKGGRFAVLDGERGVFVSRRPNFSTVRPVRGAAVLVDPRVEDPLEYFVLEIVDTFLFLPCEGLSLADEQRADYTIKLLDLNREYLRIARGEAYGAYRARLVEYRKERKRRAPAKALARLADAIIASAHPTVWREMQRQYSQISEVATLFEDVPEALDW